MSTYPHTPNEAQILPLVVPLKQTRRNREISAGEIRRGRPSSPGTQRDGKSGSAFSLISDDGLITAARCGDQEAFGELCRRHSYPTKRKILRMLQNHEDAEDAMQDALLRAYMNLGSFRGTCKFSTWLTTIAVNSALMLMRKRRRRGERYANASSPDAATPEPQEPVDRSPGPEEICLRQQAIFLVKRSVEALLPRLRSVVMHYYESEGSVQESAKALDISVSAAKSRLARSRARLRSSLTKYGVSKSGNGAVRAKRGSPSPAM